MMSSQEIIEQIKALPPEERARVAAFVVEEDDSWIPQEFKDAMKEAEAGRLVSLETALFETPPQRLRRAIVIEPLNVFGPRSIG